MRFLDKKQKLERLLFLIENENTGTARQISDRLCVSIPTNEKYLALSREDGYRIGYCTSRKTYYLIDYN